MNEIWPVVQDLCGIVQDETVLVTRPESVLVLILVTRNRSETTLHLHVPWYSVWPF